MRNIDGPWFALAVADLEKAKNFYEIVMEQKIESDIEGEHVVFENGFALQADYVGIVEGSKNFAPHPTGARIQMKTKANNCQLCFEVQDLDYWASKIKAIEDIEIIHDITEYNWGQRVMRFYDYDGHIIEIDEDLAIVIRRFLEQGLSFEDIAQRFEYSVEYVEQLLNHDTPCHNIKK